VFSHAPLPTTPLPQKIFEFEAFVGDGVLANVGEGIGAEVGGGVGVFTGVVGDGGGGWF